MRVRRRGPIAWWSPDPRGVIPLEGLHVSRSLRGSRNRFEIRVDTAFADVIRGCADPSRPSGWIEDDFIDAYTRLHQLGWVHSVEAWTRDPEPVLAGGVYGVAIGGLFAGESMFHRARDASKVALAALVDLLHPEGVLDIQWVTPHLASLGAIAIPAHDYQSRLARALTLPLPEAFTEV